MAITDLYSKRQKRLRGEIPDVFTYDVIPEQLKVQIVHIIKNTIGSDNNNDLNRERYLIIHDTLCREYGMFSLVDDNYLLPSDKVFNFFLSTENVEQAIDVIELTLQVIDTVIRRSYTISIRDTSYRMKPDEAINELNHRFKEHGVGYQYEAGQIIKVDSTYTHSEIVKPTIALLYNHKFQGASEEYLKAHEHYRYGRNKECLTDCCKAFESVMKIICKEKSWTYKDSDTSSKLIKSCLDNGLIDPLLQSQLTSLRSLLESGIPALRNNLGGHGQGQTIKTVDDEMARFALNLTGSNIILLVELSGIK